MSRLTCGSPRSDSLTCHAGIRDAAAPGTDTCTCPCDSLHPEIPACDPITPTRQVLVFDLAEQTFTFAVCPPCTSAVDEAHAGRHADDR